MKLSLAEEMAVYELGYYPQPWESDWKPFNLLVKQKQRELNGVWDSSTMVFNACKGRKTQKKRVRIPAKQQFLAQF
jgi:hypothetical protein